MLPLTGEIFFSEQERRSLILYQLAQNVPDVPLLGVFREYEEYGLPGYAPLDPDRVRSTTFALMQALKYNTHVTEFVLNVKALELLLLDENNHHHHHTCHTHPSHGNGIAPLLNFLQNNPSLTTLNIRVPPGTKESEYFVGLFASCLSFRAIPFHSTLNFIQCPNLKEVTLWVPRERPQRLRMLRMMMRYSTSACAASGAAANIPASPKTPSITETTDTTTTFTGTISTTVGKAEQSSSYHFPLPKESSSCSPSRLLIPSTSPVLQLPGLLSGSPLDDDEDQPEEDEEDYDLTGIARFVAQQPQLTYVRVQASSLTVQQWAALTRQLAMSVSLRHVELRRVEVDSTSMVLPFLPIRAAAAAAAAAVGSSTTASAGCTSSNNDKNNNTSHSDGDCNTASTTRAIAEHLALLGHGLERLDLHGTSIDVSPFMIRKTTKDLPTHRTDQDEMPPSSSNDTTNVAVPHRPLTALSWSSANLVNMQRLMDALSHSSATLRKLELSHLNLSGAKCRCLAEMLRRNTSIQHLNLSRAQLDCVDATHLAAGLTENQTLRQWQLMDNHIWRRMPNAPNRFTHYFPLATAAVADAGSENATAQHNAVAAYYSTLAFQSFRDLLEANTKLEELDLSDNGLDTVDQDDRYGILMQGLERNTNLVSLKVCNQSNLLLDTLQTSSGRASPLFHCSVSQHVGKVLNQNCLQEMVLDYNRFRDEDLAQYMAPALRGNTTLRILGLKRVRMGNTGMIAIAKNLLNHPSLEFFDVSFNTNVTAEGYQALAQALRCLPKLHTLWFHDMTRHREDDAMTQHKYTLILAQALEDNSSLKRMSHSEILKGKQKFYFTLNQFDRQRLCDESNRSMNMALWPTFLVSMPLELRAFYLRRNTTLLASVSSQPPPPTKDTAPSVLSHNKGAARNAAARSTKRPKLATGTR